jgi:hypothetical protein
MSMETKNTENPLQLANQLFRRYRARCFWHSPKDLVITDELIPFVIKGLRANGGREGFVLSGKLKKASLVECR